MALIEKSSTTGTDAVAGLGQNEIVRLVGFALFLIAVGVALGAWLNYSASAASKEWIRNLQFNDKSFASANLPSRVPASTEQVRLMEQFREVGGRAHMHMHVMQYFYTRYDLALLLASGAAVVAAFCLFHISKKGWDEANAYVQVLFVIAAGTALLLGVFPRLFRQDQNIADNKALYINYVALGNEIRTYLATGTAVLPTDTSVTLPEFVRYVDNRLATLNAIPVGFDETQVPDYRKLQVTETK
jgi:hypothetical protein